MRILSFILDFVVSASQPFFLSRQLGLFIKMTVKNTNEFRRERRKKCAVSDGTHQFPNSFPVLNSHLLSRFSVV
jgi:hypothetical protein